MSRNHHTNQRDSHQKGSAMLYRLGSVVSGTEWHRGPFAGKRAPEREGAPTCRYSQIIRVSSGHLNGVFISVTAIPRYPDIAVTLETTLLASMYFNPRGGRHVTKPRSAGCRAGLDIEKNIGLLVIEDQPS